jgi:hypothetical protein
MDINSYFQINENKQTGTFHFKTASAEDLIITFIITKYNEEPSGTYIDIEYISNYELVRIFGVSRNDEITFTCVVGHDVDITREGNREKTEYETEIFYEVTVLKFARAE